MDEVGKVTGIPTFAATLVTSALTVTPELLALAAEESTGVLFLTDLAHRIVWANGAFVRATGFSLEEVIGEVPTMLFGDDETDRRETARIMARLDAGERVTSNLRLRRKDGTSFWTALAIAPLLDASGSVTCFLTNCIDITPNKIAEQRLANIIAGTRAGTWEWNVQTGEVRFNERWAEIIGYSLADLEPVSIDTWLAMAHPEDLPTSAALLERHFSGHAEYYECLCRMRHRLGHFVWVHDRGQVVEWDANGSPLWMAGTHIDVTEMVQTAEALREARDRAQHVLDTVQSVIITLDVEGRVVQLNAAGCELVGLTEEDIRGRDWFTEFHPPEHVEGLRQAYGHLMALGGPGIPHSENEIVTARGDRRLLRWHHVVQRDEQGQPTGLLSSGEDITEIRHLERLTTRRQRLESIGTLAGGIAHDLNNALSPLVMGMGLLRELAPRDGPLLEMMDSSAKRAAEMVRQLLAFARGADGEQQPLDVSASIREVERLVRTTFPKNITLTVDLPSDVPEMVGDATQLHQVLVNLAVNARDAMPDGGLLAISVQCVEVDEAEASRISVAAARAGRYLRFSVRDTGEGIPQSLLDRIFDPFYTTKGPDQGTGLGLSTVLGIVKGHDGFVRVDSRPGLGSTFHVYLPIPDTGRASTSEAPATPAVVSARASTAGGLVLFVDDEPFIRSMCTMLAGRVGFAAVTAGSTVEALQLLRRSAHGVSAVVTDLHMPGRDGLALAREVRSGWPDLPVMLVSGLMTDDLWRQVHELGGIEVLPKPFSEHQLREALMRSVSRGAAAPSSAPAQGA